MHVEYRVTNLAELMATIEHIKSELAAAGRPVHPSEVILGTPEFKCLDLCLRSERLSDGSEVFNIEVPNLVGDVCIVGNSAVNGICGDRECVCQREEFSPEDQAFADGYAPE